jgi:hypothetical protein
MGWHGCYSVKVFTSVSREEEFLATDGAQMNTDEDKTEMGF